MRTLKLNHVVVINDTLPVYIRSKACAYVFRCYAIGKYRHICKICTVGRFLGINTYLRIGVKAVSYDYLRAVSYFYYRRVVVPVVKKYIVCGTILCITAYINLSVNCKCAANKTYTTAVVVVCRVVRNRAAAHFKYAAGEFIGYSFANDAVYSKHAVVVYTTAAVCIVARNRAVAAHCEYAIVAYTAAVGCRVARDCAAVHFKCAVACHIYTAAVGACRVVRNRAAVHSEASTVHINRTSAAIINITAGQCARFPTAAIAKSE